MAVDDAVSTAIESGGLVDAERYLANKISYVLLSKFQTNYDVKILRMNDFDPYAVFYFDVLSGDMQVRFSLEGVKDPLLAMRLGLNWVWREDPNHPYTLHGNSTVMSRCLTNHYFHIAEDGPDFFARLENKTSDPYHFGVETFILHEGKLAVDHLLLSGGEILDDKHRELYGLD